MLSAVFSVVWWLLASVLTWIFSPVPLAVIAITCGSIYYLWTRKYDYWPSKGVRGPKSKFPWGTEFGSPFKVAVWKFNEWLYFKQGGKKYCGYMELHNPVLYVGDLDLIRCITIKDFEHFTDRRVVVLTEQFRKMLTVLNGQEWKDTRSTMSPTFSSSKLRQMHQVCLNNAENLCAYIREEMKTKAEIELKDSFGRFTMDNIAACAFGVNCNSFTDPNCEFAKNAAKLFEPLSVVQSIRITLAVFCGDWAANLLPDSAAALGVFFSDVINKTTEHRAKNNEVRNDFLQLLLNTKDKYGNRMLTDESIMAQSVLFFIVGYDTTATLLSFAAFCLASEPQWQRRVHEEIDQVLQKHGNALTYEAVSEMTFLDNVLSETLRLYPPAVTMERQCSKDYVLPGTNVKIEKGTVVRMPILPVHRDPDIYPDPLKFDPDRFLPEAREARHPCAYMPFGSGPRNCIAMRFALFEAKVALVAVLRNNKMEPAPSTPEPPMPLADEGFLLAPKKGFGYIRVIPRE